MCGFCQRGRIGNLQMQRRDLRMDEVATAKCSGDCREPANLHVEFDGQAVTFAEIAIEIRHCAWTPFVKANRTARPFQYRHSTHEHAILATRNPAPGHVRQAKTSSQLGH
jgi:hypothetical protein